MKSRSIIYCIMIFLMFGFGPLWAEETLLNIQTRYRTDLPKDVPDSKTTFPFKIFDGYDYQIIYKSLQWQTSETAILYDRPSNAETSMITRIENAVEVLRKQGAPILFLETCKDSTQLLLWLKNKRVKNVLILGVTLVDNDQATPVIITSKNETLSLAAILKEKFSMVVVRDLITTLKKDALKTASNVGTTTFRLQEQMVASLERSWCPTITSCDILGGPAYRFSTDNRKEIVFLVSDDHYSAEKILPLFGEFLMERYPVYCSVIHGEGTSQFKNIDELDRADCLVVYIRRLGIPAVLLSKIKNHLAMGKGVVGLRTASHAFAPNGTYPKDLVVWPDFDKEVQGGNYHNHGPNDKGTDVRNRMGTEKEISLLLTGVVPNQWHSIGSLYFTSPVVADSIILQFGSITGAPDEPLTWIRYYGKQKSRIAYSGLGHPDDFNQTACRNLFRNLFFWSMGAENLIKDNH